MSRFVDLTGDRADLCRRFTVSANTSEGVTPTGEFRSWFAEQRHRNRFRVERIRFRDLSGWRFDRGGNLSHESGRFFTVTGLRVRTDWQDRGSWMQPIINQPEIGLLGFLVKEFDGVLHCLVQAKMEPGNTNTVQLSPTVQATRSNFTGVHGGRTVPYLEHFTGRHVGTSGPERVLVDVLQSEQGAWFLRKRNRNIVVETTADVPSHPDFRWLTIGQLHECLRQDTVVNMDARTVLSCLPFQAPNAPRSGIATGEYREALLRSMWATYPSLHPTAELLSWLTAVRFRYEVLQETVPLGSVQRWYRTGDEIGHRDGRYFTVIAADVQASNREVTSWRQPLLAPVGQGVCAFLARRIDGVLHVLVGAKVEAGMLNVAELAPTVQCIPGYSTGAPGDPHPDYLDRVLGADPATVRYDAVQSEEGGRFYHADNRYRIVEVDDEVPLKVPGPYRWMTVGQLTELCRQGNYLNVQARSLLAGLHATW